MTNWFVFGKPGVSAADEEGGAWPVNWVVLGKPGVVETGVFGLPFGLVNWFVRGNDETDGGPFIVGTDRKAPLGGAADTGVTGDDPDACVGWTNAPGGGATIGSGP